MNKSWQLVLAAAVILGALFILSRIGKKAPPLPVDSVHSIIANQSVCIACHAEGKQSPLAPNHPPKEQCLVCHKAK